jgi:hypothetical protein
MSDTYFTDTKMDKRERNNRFDLNRIDCCIEKGTGHTQRKLETK